MRLLVFVLLFSLLMPVAIAQDYKVGYLYYQDDGFKKLVNKFQLTVPNEPFLDKLSPNYFYIIRDSETSFKKFIDEENISNKKKFDAASLQSYGKVMKHDYILLIHMHGEPDKRTTYYDVAHYTNHYQQGPKGTTYSGTTYEGTTTESSTHLYGYSYQCKASLLEVATGKFIANVEGSKSVKKDDFMQLGIVKALEEVDKQLFPTEIVRLNKMPAGQKVLFDGVYVQVMPNNQYHVLRFFEDGRVISSPAVTSMNDTPSNLGQVVAKWLDISRNDVGEGKYWTTSTGEIRILLDKKGLSPRSLYVGQQSNGFLMFEDKQYRFVEAL